MRRKEVESTDMAEIHAILDRAEVGTLGIMVADNSPRVVPINFVRLDGNNALSFHCAMEGEKWEALQNEPEITFSAYLPYSIIPSYWLSNNHGCGATHFFKSVQINGVAKVLIDPSDKASALQKLMEKYQPEGRYQTIRPDEPMYSKMLVQTGVVSIVPSRVTCKIKFGQNHPVHTREKLVGLLEERGEPVDLLTAEEIRKNLGNPQ